MNTRTKRPENTSKPKNGPAKESQKRDCLESDTITNQAKAYVAKFDDDGENIPTKAGYMAHMGITDDHLKDEAPNSYELRRGLMHVEIFLEKALRGPQSPILAKVMMELGNNFGWVTVDEN